jgi:hypothetical protein
MEPVFCSVIETLVKVSPEVVRRSADPRQWRHGAMYTFVWLPKRLGGLFAVRRCGGLSR